MSCTTGIHICELSSETYPEIVDDYLKRWKPLERPRLRIPAPPPPRPSQEDKVPKKNRGVIIIQM